MDLSLQVGGGCNPLQVTDIHACAAVEKNIKKEKAWKKIIHAGRGTETSQFTPKYISALRRVRNLSRSVCHS